MSSVYYSLGISVGLRARPVADNKRTPARRLSRRPAREIRGMYLNGPKIYYAQYRYLGRVNIDKREESIEYLW